MCNPPTYARQHHRVRSDIHQQCQTAQYDLSAAREAARIQHRLDIVLDESATVTSFAAPHSQRILERSEWAYPSAVLYEDSPNRRWNVQQRQPRPTQNEKSSQDDKQDEREMQYEYDVREGAVNQAAGGTNDGGSTTGGAADASKVIVFSSSMKRGSLRNGSTIG